MTDVSQAVGKIAEGNADALATVTLASLVEKETGVAEERPLVAGVFANSAGQGMRLECDPTTIYAALLENRYRDAIHRSDLESQNPYNTYQNAGLPPGPIANPGATPSKPRCIRPKPTICISSPSRAAAAISFPLILERTHRQREPIEKNRPSRGDARSYFAAILFRWLITNARIAAATSSVDSHCLNAGIPACT